MGLYPSGSRFLHQKQLSKQGGTQSLRKNVKKVQNEIVPEFLFDPIGPTLSGIPGYPLICPGSQLANRRLVGT